MQGIYERVGSVRLRQQWQWIIQCLAWGLVAGGSIATILGASILAEWLNASHWIWVVIAIVAGPAAGLLWALIRSRPLRGAAIAIDRHYALKDRIVTALAFLDRRDLTSLQQLQLADADAHLHRADPLQVAPYRVPRPLMAGLTLSALAVVLTVLSASPESATAAPAVNTVVLTQARRVDEELEKLEAFQQEEPDPELEQLLKELSQKIEELEQPGVDPKEALAKLSEIQAALESRQEQLSQMQTEAQLQSVGEALSLAEPLKAAGLAMSAGELDKAAAELEKLELPQLDRQTERALTEKLEQLRQGPSAGQKSLKEALGQVSSGVSQGNGAKFRDGMKGLAGECRSQARRKKLADLLRKQCQCLCECKGECESECRNTVNSDKKGGKKWGLASSSNTPGDKTALLTSNQKMNLKGQESGEGEVDVETLDSTAERQQASRQYREKVDKYQQLSESVLDAEPIPLGHRQTIRRYFEMIRPQGAEADAVDGRLSPSRE